jgi:hypothetical protein
LKGVGAKQIEVLVIADAKELTLTVLSGTLYFGFGDQFDENKLTPYPAGTFFSEVPNVPHFVAAKDGEVIFQATGIGPTALIPAHHSPE